MTHIVRRFSPAIFHPSVFDEAFADIDDIFGKYKTNVPYNVKQKVDKNGDVISCNIEVALAGYNKGDIVINVVDDELVIKVNKAEGEADDDINWAHKGISQKSIHLKFKLGGMLNKTGIKSTFKNGLLTVDIPASKKEVIDININD